MKELSIFVDESGDFGEYDHHSPFYIISMVLHDQSVEIDNDLKALENELANIGWPKHCLIVAVQRGTNELLPKGSTKMEASDMLVIMTDEKNQAYVDDLMNKLCSESK